MGGLIPFNILETFTGIETCYKSKRRQELPSKSLIEAYLSTTLYPLAIGLNSVSSSSSLRDLYDLVSSSSSQSLVGVTLLGGLVLNSFQNTEEASIPIACRGVHRVDTSRGMLSGLKAIVSCSFYLVISFLLIPARPSQMMSAGKGRPDLTLFLTLIWSRWFSFTNTSDNAIPVGVDSWALDPFGPRERVTLGRGLVNQLVAPLVEVSGPFFRCLGYTFGIPQKGIFSTPAIFTLHHADSPFIIRRGIRPRGIPIGTSPLDFTHRRSRHSPRFMGKDVDRSPWNYIIFFDSVLPVRSIS
ncbi:hypothetical protein M9H77_27046 [Catharanthus roseus]|uniref:Uncharacterized protein n=1 Tax=Catharanthus roseus TaxID=4058 RepID=A0ACC0AFN5_CATRO|nr:hypothetical protein M9H77_27046 [Catharanthus roseus]